MMLYLPVICCLQLICIPFETSLGSGPVSELIYAWIIKEGPCHPSESMAHLSALLCGGLHCLGTLQSPHWQEHPYWMQLPVLELLILSDCEPNEPLLGCACVY